MKLTKTKDIFVIKKKISKISCKIPKNMIKQLCFKSSIAIFKSLLNEKLGYKIHREVKIMNKYESIIIVNPNVDEAGLKALEEKFTG